MSNRGYRARIWAANLGLAVASLAVGAGLVEMLARREAARLSSRIHSHGELVRYSPTLGWDKPPGEDTVYLQSEYQVVFHVNSRGLRGPERDYVKPQGVTRVLLLGDSFVEGYTVGEESLVSTVLESRLKLATGSPYEVINGGTHGYGTDQEYLFYGEEGRRYQPDVVVLFFYSNDLSDNLSTAHKPFFEEQNGSLIQRNTPVPPPAPGKEVRRPSYDRHSLRPFRGSYALRLLGSRIENASPSLQGFLARLGLIEVERVEAGDVQERFLPYAGPEYGPQKKKMWTLAFALIEALDKAVRAEGARFLVFYVPARFEVNDVAWALTRERSKMEAPDWRADRVFRVLQEGCGERGIELIDPREALRRAEGTSQAAYFVGDPHWSEVGHRIAAEALVPALLAEQTPRLRTPG
jgi:hypothetical protein